MTVIDYSRIEEIQQEMVKKCPPDAHMTCRGTGPDGPSGSGYSKLDKAGAYDWATWKIIQRGVEDHPVPVDLRRLHHGALDPLDQR